MTITSESSTAPRASVEKPRPRPRMVRWFMIVGILLALLVVILVGFNKFRENAIKGFFDNMAKNPKPIAVSVADATSEVVPNLISAVGDLAAVHQVNVTSDVNGRITDIQFTAGATVK